MKNKLLTDAAEKLIEEFTCPVIEMDNTADYTRWHAITVALQHCELVIQLPAIQQSDELIKWQRVHEELSAADAELKHIMAIDNELWEPDVLSITADKLLETVVPLTDEEFKQQRKLTSELREVRDKLRFNPLSETERNLLFAHWMDLMKLRHHLFPAHPFYADVENYLGRRNKLVDEAHVHLTAMRNPALTNMQLIEQIEKFTGLTYEVGMLDHKMLVCYRPRKRKANTGGQAVAANETQCPGER